MNCPYCGRDITAHFPLTDAQRRVLNEVESWRVQTMAMIADRTGYGVRYTQVIMRQLIQLQLVESRGRKRGYIRPAFVLERAA